MLARNDANDIALRLLHVAFKLHIDRLQEAYERAKTGLEADFHRANPNKDPLEYREDVLSEIKATNPYKGVAVPDPFPILQEGIEGHVKDEGMAMLSRAQYAAPNYKIHKSNVDAAIIEAQEALNTHIGKEFSPGDMANLRETLSAQWGQTLNGFELVLPFATGLEEYHETDKLKGIFSLSRDGKSFVLDGYTTELGYRPYVLP